MIFFSGALIRVWSSASFPARASCSLPAESRFHGDSYRFALSICLLQAQLRTGRDLLPARFSPGPPCHLKFSAESQACGTAPRPGFPPAICSLRWPVIRSGILVAAQPVSVPCSRDFCAKELVPAHHFIQRQESALQRSVVLMPASVSA
jgi:hypothetical protein